MKIRWVGTTFNPNPTQPLGHDEWINPNLQVAVQAQVADKSWKVCSAEVPFSKVPITPKCSEPCDGLGTHPGVHPGILTLTPYAAGTGTRTLPQGKNGSRKKKKNPKRNSTFNVIILLMLSLTAYLKHNSVHIGWNRGGAAGI